MAKDEEDKSIESDKKALAQGILNWVRVGVQMKMAVASIFVVSNRGPHLMAVPFSNIEDVEKQVNSWSKTAKESNWKVEQIELEEADEKNHIVFKARIVGLDEEDPAMGYIQVQGWNWHKEANDWV